jgi:hypothetical protein
MRMDTAGSSTMMISDYGVTTIFIIINVRNWDPDYGDAILSNHEDGGIRFLRTVHNVLSY